MLHKNRTFICSFGRDVIHENTVCVKNMNNRHTHFASIAVDKANTSYKLMCLCSCYSEVRQSSINQPKYQINTSAFLL